MKKLLIVVGVLAVLGVVISQAGEDDWGRAALGELSDDGVDTAFPDGALLGEGAVTGCRAGVLGAGLLSRAGLRPGCTDAMAGVPAARFSFSDVPVDHWGAGAAARVAAL